MNDKYAIKMPEATHFRKATCQEMRCPRYLMGWTTTVDMATDLGKRQHDYIKYKSGRRFEVTGPGLATLVTFTFPPGQECFSSWEHRIRDHKIPPHLLKIKPTGERSSYREPERFQNDFNENFRTKITEV